YRRTEGDTDEPHTAVNGTDRAALVLFDAARDESIQARQDDADPDTADHKNSNKGADPFKKSGKKKGTDEQKTADKCEPLHQTLFFSDIFSCHVGCDGQ